MFWWEDINIFEGTGNVRGTMLDVIGALLRGVAVRMLRVGYSSLYVPIIGCLAPERDGASDRVPCCYIAGAGSSTACLR